MLTGPSAQNVKQALRSGAHMPPVQDLLVLSGIKVTIELPSLRVVSMKRSNRKMLPRQQAVHRCL